MENTNLGNFGFWINFCLIGQPLIFILYYIEVVSDAQYHLTAEAAL